jgi:ribosomal protein S18 acetylase RimI-like enzyme
MLIYQDGVAAAGGMYYRTEDTAEILHIGTRPSFRGNGHGHAVTAALTNHAFDHGVRLASLQATPMGLPIYQRLGYETVSTYHCYLRMPK